VSSSVTVQANGRVLQGAEAEQMLRAMESATGMDLDGDGRIAGEPAPPQAGPPPPAPDTTSELERLAALHASGALSDEEFAAAKARILGQSP
jgi:hypothetical protein